MLSIICINYVEKERLESNKCIIIIIIIILFFQLELSELAPNKICIALSKYIVTLQSGELDMTKCKYIIIF
jgi:hypothetical protein